MNDEFIIPSGTIEEQIEYIDQWNVNHPDDVHSPWMGALDVCNQDVVEEPVVEETIEVAEPIQKSPKTGDFYFLPCVTMTVLATGLLIYLVILKLRRKYVRK